MDWPKLIESLLTQSPLVVVLGFMWWRESSARDRLQEKLHETQAATITTLEGVKNTLDIIRSEVSR